MNLSFCGLYRLVAVGLTLLASVLMTSPLRAADCSAPDISLQLQSDVDNFQTTYGPCDTVTGSLSMAITDIANVDGLSALTSVGGNLAITHSALLIDLNGLASLTYVGGSLAIANNDALTNLDVLASLTSVGSYLVIGENDALTNLDGLSALTSVGGYLQISGNAALTNLDGLSALTSVGNSLQIYNNAVLTNLDGLSALTSVGDSLNVYNNAALTDVDGLSALISVGISLQFYNNAALTNLDGLSALTSLGNGLNIFNNAVLTSLDGLSALTSVGGYLQIFNNTALTNLDGLSSLISVGTDLILHDNPQLAVCYALAPLLDDVDDALPGPGPGAAGIPDVGGAVTISNNLPGCNSIAQILSPRPAAGTAVLAIQKRFSDGNSQTPVTLHLQCSTGSYAPQTVTVYPDDAGQPWGDYGMIEHIFVVSDIALVNGEGAACTVTEEPIAGYAAEYKCKPEEQMSTADPSCVPDDYDVPSDNFACAWSDVQEGDSNNCLIVNDPLPVEVAVTKVWDVSNTGGDYVSRDAVITIGCDAEMSPYTWEEEGLWFYRAVLAEGSYAGDQATVTVRVIPGYPGSYCFAEEEEVSSAVEVTSDCGSFKEPSLEVAAGLGANCTITNTLFFEGIPTLNQWGMALMALLMLGIGTVGLRRIT